MFYRLAYQFLRAIVQCKRTYIVIATLVSVGFIHAADFTVTGEIRNFAGDMRDVQVILENRTEFLTTTPDYAGTFTFNHLTRGKYFVKVQAPGYRSTPARLIHVPTSDHLDPFSLERITEEAFVFHWEEDQTASGLEYSANVNRPVQVKFLDALVTVADSRAAAYLLSEFSVILSDEGDLRWTTDHAFRLHQIMATVGKRESYGYRKDRIDRQYSRWVLTNEALVDDIEINIRRDGSKDVRIASRAFANAAPKVVAVEGKRGIWYSQRLHQAVIRFITDHGRDRAEVDRIFWYRYGVATHADFTQLTANTTRESSSSFQRFEPEERIALLNMLEEMPIGFHKIQRLTHLVRRIDGMTHPIHPEAPALAWTNAGYIEFMESAFKDSSAHYIHRLILHEKAHFIWAHLLDDTTKADWIELGEWYEDPTSPTGWSTHQTTQFVSAYAHLKNPDEDMAESMADFIVNPDVLRSRAPRKYEFVRDRIMQGSFYVSKIREDLTFEVYNLYPDYVYPGKVKRVDVRVEGKPEDDKIVHIEIELHRAYGFNAKEGGASDAYFRLASNVGTFFDIKLVPIDMEGRSVAESTILQGQARLDKHYKAGYWYVVSGAIGDNAGNHRYQRPDTFEMKVYIDNPHEDYWAPEYVPNSVALSTRTEIQEHWGIDREMHVISVSWDVDEDKALRQRGGCYAWIDANNMESTASIGQYGHPQDERCNVDFLLPDYMASGLYSVIELVMADQGKNWGRYTFLSDGPERQPQFQLVTKNPDTKAPEIDVNRIFVNAVPTNREHPNGETVVDIVFYIRDDISGFGETHVYLRDPQGGYRWGRQAAPDGYHIYSRLPMNQWHRMEMTMILPKGSPPGTWGIAEMTTRDRAHNTKRFNFEEVVHIDVLNQANW